MPSVSSVNPDVLISVDSGNFSLVAGNLTHVTGLNVTQTVAVTSLISADAGNLLQAGSDSLLEVVDASAFSLTGGNLRHVSTSGTNQDVAVTSLISADANNLLIAGSDSLLEVAPFSITELTDTPAALGTAGQILTMNAGGTALEFSTLAVDLNSTISDESGGNYGGGAPASPPGSFDNGDLHWEYYDDYLVAWVAAGGSFPATPAAQIPLSGVGDNWGSQVVVSDGTLSGTGITGNVLSVTIGFDDLTDTPAALGTAGQEIRVNAGGTALEFYTPAADAGNYSLVSGNLRHVDFDGDTQDIAVTSLISADANNWIIAGSDSLLEVPQKATTDLSDTPATLGTANQYLGVNAGGTALEWKTLAADSGAYSLTSGNLRHTTSSGTNQDVAVTSLISADAGNWLIAGSDSLLEVPPQSFLALTDTPAALGTAGQELRMNAGGTALEFYTPAADAGNFQLAATGILRHTDFDGTNQDVQVDALISADAGNWLIEGSDGLLEVPPQSILALTDTPAALGTAGQILAMNAGATALEFITPVSTDTNFMTNDLTGAAARSHTSGGFNYSHIGIAAYTLTGTGTFDINSGPLDIDSTGATTIDATTTVGITGAAGSVTLTATGATSDVAIIAGDDFTVDAADDILLDAAGQYFLGDGAGANLPPTASTLTGFPLAVETADGELHRLSGTANQLLQMNAAGDGVEWTTDAGNFQLAATGILRHTDFDGTNQDVQVDALISADAGNWMIEGSDGLLEVPQKALTDLSDTPATLGTAGQILQVNAGATALEFVTPSTDVHFLNTDLTGTAARSHTSGTNAYSHIGITTYTLTGTGIFDINSGPLDIDATGAATIDATTTVGITAAAGTMSLTATGATSDVLVTAGDDFVVDAADDIVLDAAGQYFVGDGAGANLPPTATSLTGFPLLVETADGELHRLTGTAGQVLTVDGAGTGVSFATPSTDVHFLNTDLTGTAARSHTSGTQAYSHIGITNYTLTGTGTFDINSGPLDMDATGAANIAATTTITLDATTNLILDAAGEYFIGDGAGANLPDVLAANDPSYPLVIDQGTGELLINTGTTTTLDLDAYATYAAVLAAIAAHAAYKPGSIYNVESATAGYSLGFVIAPDLTIGHVGVGFGDAISIPDAAFAVPATPTAAEANIWINTNHPVAPKGQIFTSSNGQLYFS